MYGLHCRSVHRLSYYCTTASFRLAQAAWESGAGQSIRFLFPNVELRLSHATRRDSAVNIHLLSAGENVDDLDRFLGSLEFTYGGSPYRCDDTGLKALGRAYKNDRSPVKVMSERLGQRMQVRSLWWTVPRLPTPPPQEAGFPHRP